MLLMIWVNDFWTLSNTPKWLLHAKPNEDYLGFSDVIFPLFLFIVGLSIPYAIQNRRGKNETLGSIVKHIVIRSLSLLLIGVFMVNYETHHSTLGLGKWLWCLLMAIGVSLIWMKWKRSPIHEKWHKYLRFLGWAILIALTVLYKGGNDGTMAMHPQWWGILGLIGWAYAINALVYLFSRDSLFVLVFVWLLFNVLSVGNALDYFQNMPSFLRYFSTLYIGTIPAFTTAGVLATVIFQKVSKENRTRALSILVILAFISIAFGLLTRSVWGISKVPGTPSWLAVCTGISFLSFVLFYYLVDVKKKSKWAQLILPAGTATLTCYLIPYFSYPLRNLTGISLPDFLNDSSIGLFSSFCFGLLVVVFTGWLQKKGFSLKL